MKLPLLTPTGLTGSTNVSDALFGADVKLIWLAQAARVYLANGRQATSQVKTRSDINRTKKKWYRQKGTGGARHGARTANIFVGGGVSHGPDGSQNFNLGLTPRFKRQALMAALTVQKDHCLVISEIVPLTNQTKMAAAFIKPAVKPGEKVLLVTKNDDLHVQRSVSNLDYVTLRSAAGLSAFDVIKADKILFAPDSLIAVEKKLATTKQIKPAKPQKPVVAPVTKAKIKPASKTSTAKVVPAQVATTETTPAKVKVSQKPVAKVTATKKSPVTAKKTSPKSKPKKKLT